MKLLIFIVIGIITVWMSYEMVFKHRGNEKDNDEIIRDIDKGNKWYYYKLKLILFGIILIAAAILIIIWFIIKAS